MNSAGDQRGWDGVHGIPYLPVITREQLDDYFRRRESVPLPAGGIAPVDKQRVISVGVDGIPNIPVITREQLRDYLRRPQQSPPILGRIAPFILNEVDKQRVTNLAKRCLQLYNDQNERRFEFHELVYVKRQCGPTFSITFTARSADNAFETFYGEVWHKFDNTLHVRGIVIKQ
ncbi:hypothetical protein HN51_053346 [Arachis hypogaea]|uniref:Cystatin domain-containing protein n=1 Tax=Arachis hypogaea TaxID=3818 RepID=A0A6B9V2T7_ARAHY|nr:uncharacterized protein LOC110267223 [Arachis ipaensis]XP_025674921.1 uncharacterized protein LOC112775497 [Arachis hypogaea]QHN75676.1 uncharacterized protein DS421_19g637330 [Arachis hypogaea]